MQDKKSLLFLLGAIFLGVITGLFGQELPLKGAEITAALFMNFLKLLSIPIIFLSIISTLSGMKSQLEISSLGKRVLTYTLLTTVIAATVGLVLFLIIQPNAKINITDTAQITKAPTDTYLSFLWKIVPSNIVQVFLENNVIGTAFIGFIMGVAATYLPEDSRISVHQVFSSLFKLILKITEGIAYLIPLGTWAFTALMFKGFNHTNSFKHLGLYLLTIVSANLVQGFIILPLLLKCKGISPVKLAKASLAALSLAFFSKSSNATLPVTLKCAEKEAGIHPKVAHFSLPLCTIINMNGCAAFILITVLFCSTIHGHTFGLLDLGIWVVLSTFAAIGNAGIPMGCFFLTSMFLIGMDVPLSTMGLILPFYAFIDMIETSLNVWSDLSVTAIVDKECTHLETLSVKE
ncbi:dicarboxylate/amino acid:cation symporter [Candidatus Rhabdochlamydia porcellionis]|jgi:Na+/H+-dicarboxylate symporter|uniref:Proton/glutamate-aspartate symporter n=1 Tax=Candidatus Rhabdochlamydia porcellionis TaxID=225148 RepID=A0ABX8YZN2_9BACT|nr:dicarboxylate/amino acid:cation symporter [Candidatus Rhabdochlamydia porcellionis]QZA58859.1 Proton/glutamate-aspartate symporter [Candidatus Rhabdochlamydia porcellionis]